MHLWDSKQAVMNIPNLCIHFNRKDSFEPNKEKEFKPIFATTMIDQLMGEGKTIFNTEHPDIYNVEKKHFVTFLERIAKDINVSHDEIIDFELTAYDHHPPAIIGLHNEFIASPRLDNLCSSLCSLDAIIEYKQSGEQDNREVSMIMLFDHEEVGSQSA